MKKRKVRRVATKKKHTHKKARRANRYKTTGKKLSTRSRKVSKPSRRKPNLPKRRKPLRPKKSLRNSRPHKTKRRKRKTRAQLLAETRRLKAQLAAEKRKARRRKSRRLTLPRDATKWTGERIFKVYPKADPQDVLLYWTKKLAEQDVRPNEVVDSTDLMNAQTWAEHIASELGIRQHDVYDAWLSPPIDVTAPS